jgi:hypothetical protein
MYPIHSAYCAEWVGSAMNSRQAESRGSARRGYDVWVPPVPHSGPGKHKLKVRNHTVINLV